MYDQDGQEYPDETLGTNPGTPDPDEETALQCLESASSINDMWAALNRMKLDTTRDTDEARSPHCQACGAADSLHVSHEAGRSVCQTCGAINDEWAPTGQGGSLPMPHLHVSGKNGDSYTRDLYRSAQAPSSKTKVDATINYLIAAQNMHMAEHADWRAIPPDVLKLCAEYVLQIQNTQIMRNTKRKSVIGECLRIACTTMAEKNQAGIIPSKADICAMLQMRTSNGGLAHGTNTIARLVSDGVSTIPFNQDTKWAEISNMMGLLGYADSPRAEFGHVRAIIADIVVALKKRHIGTKLAARSLRATVVWLTIMGWPHAGEIPNPPDFATFCKKIGIKENTIKNALVIFSDHASIVQSVFLSAGGVRYDALTAAQ